MLVRKTQEFNDSCYCDLRRALCKVEVLRVLSAVLGHGYKSQWYPVHH